MEKEEPGNSWSGGFLQILHVSLALESNNKTNDLVPGLEIFGARGKITLFSFVTGKILLSSALETVTLLFSSSWPCCLSLRESGLVTQKGSQSVILTGFQVRGFLCLDLCSRLLTVDYATVFRLFLQSSSWVLLPDACHLPVGSFCINPLLSSLHIGACLGRVMDQATHTPV